MIEKIYDQPNLFVPHADEICNTMDELMKTYGYIATLKTNTQPFHSFMSIVMPVLPVLLPGWDGKYKYEVYRMILNIVDGSKLMVKHTQIVPIWKCLKIGINETDLYARCAAYDAFIYFVAHFQKVIVKQAIIEDVYVHLLQVVEQYCHGYCTGIVHLEVGNEKRLFETLKHFCEKLNTRISSVLPITVERLLSALDMLGLHMENAIELVIGSFDTVFEISDMQIEPHLPKLTDKFKTFLMKIFTDNVKEFPIKELAKAFGSGKFLWFIVSIVLKLFDASKDHKFRAHFYLLLGAVSSNHQLDAVVFLSKIMIRMTASVKLLETKTTANVHVEKKQAIESLRLLALHTENAFLPYIQLCSDAVYVQLNHPEMDIRQALIATLSQFAVSFFQMKKIERSEQITMKIYPDFIKMLKTDISTVIAISILRAFKKLLNESGAIFDGKTKLIDELFSCVNDVMGAKLACQGDTNFYKNMDLIEAALDVFLAFDDVMSPCEFAVLFDSIVPVLCEKLEATK